MTVPSSRESLPAWKGGGCFNALWGVAAAVGA